MIGREEINLDDYELIDKDFDLFIKKGLEAYGLLEKEESEDESIDR